MFVDRAEELAALEHAFVARPAQLVIVYGRRRVGKTALVREFARDKKTVYYAATKLPEPQQLRELGQAVGALVDDPLLGDVGFASWSQFFPYLARLGERIVVVIDEFPYLVEANPAVASVWQRGWDEHLLHSRVFVILLGSAVGMMERETLDARAPLYGRRTAQLRLHPLRFADAAAFYPRWEFADRVRAYAVFGGVPYYLVAIDDRVPLHEAIATTVLRRGAPLRDEVEFLLRQELQEPRTYFAILHAIAQGRRRAGEIANATGLAHGTLSKYLSVLQALDLVRREVPLTEDKPEKSKKGLYAIVDPYVRFWFRFVLPQRGLLELERHGEVVARIRRELDHFTAATYEEICRDAVGRGLLDEPSRPPWQRVGRWWDGSAGIDVVALDAGGEALLLGECKWSVRPVGTNVLRELERASVPLRATYPARRPIYALFSKSGFTPALLAERRARSDLELLHGLELVS